MRSAEAVMLLQAVSTVFLHGMECGAAQPAGCRLCEESSQAHPNSECASCLAIILGSTQMKHKKKHKKYIPSNMCSVVLCVVYIIIFIKSCDLLYFVLFILSFLLSHAIY